MTSSNSPAQTQVFVVQWAAEPAARTGHNAILSTTPRWFRQIAPLEGNEQLPDDAAFDFRYPVAARRPRFKKGADALAQRVQVEAHALGLFSQCQVTCDEGVEVSKTRGADSRLSMVHAAVCTPAVRFLEAETLTQRHVNIGAGAATATTGHPAVEPSTVFGLSVGGLLDRRHRGDRLQVTRYALAGAVRAYRLPLPIRFGSSFGSSSRNSSRSFRYVSRSWSLVPARCTSGMFTCAWTVMSCAEKI